MGRAARAIIIENGKILVMKRSKQGDDYFTLVGGRIDEDEQIEQALIREVHEETGLSVVAAQYVFYEEHPKPYNEQYIFLCKVAPHQDVALQDASEEALLNRMGTNIHEPVWAEVSAFAKLPFRTPQLQAAIVRSLSKGFPSKPVRL